MSLFTCPKSNPVMSFFQRIDFQKLAGINNVLGIELTDDGAYIVELQRRGYLLEKSSTGFKAVQSLALQWEEAQSLEERAKKLQDLLRQKSPKTKFAVANVRSDAVRSLVVEVP